MPKWPVEDVGQVMRTTMAPPRRTDVSSGTKAVRAVFGFLGLVVAIAAAIYAYNREESVWLAVFVGLLALQLISRGMADVITDSKKVRRALYFLLSPAAAAASFYVAYQAWEKWWLAFVLGLVGAWIANMILGPLLFPAIHREEKEDTAERWGMKKPDV